MQENFESASSALVALAHLIERKAWLLIPQERPEPEEPEFEALPIEPSVQQYELAIEALQVWHSEQDHHFYRSSGDAVQYELPFDLDTVTPIDLACVLERLLKKAIPDKPEILNKPRRSLVDQMHIVSRTLGSEWVPIDGLVTEPLTRGEVVWWFLALLELIRLGQARVKLQYGEILFQRGDAK